MTEFAHRHVRDYRAGRKHRVRRRSAGWSNSDVLRMAALVLGFYVVVRLLWFAHLLVLVAFLGILFGLAVSSGVDRLQRIGMARGLAAPAIVLACLGALIGFGAWMAPTVHDQTVELERRLPDAIDRANSWINARRGGVIGLVLGNVANEARVDSAVATSPPPAKGVPPAAAPTPAAQNPSASSPLRQQVAARMSSATRYLFPFLSSTVEVAGGIIIIIFLSIYIAVDPDLYRRGLMSLFPRKGRAHAGEVLSAIAAVLRKWLVTQLIAMVTLGAVTVAALLLLGVKAAIALGLLAGLLEFIPTIGPIISALPAIAMGFLDSPQKALWVALVYLGLHFCETHMMIPLLMKGGIDLPPALTIVAQALMALLFGFIGLMCAVPLLAATTVAVRLLYVERVVNEPSSA